MTIVSITLSSNIFFIIGNLGYKARVWWKSRKAVAPLEVTSNEVGNHLKGKDFVSES